MNLTELKRRPAADILKLAEELGVDNTGRSRKQTTVFHILKKLAKKGEELNGDGVLEVLSDGFGFFKGGQTVSFLAWPR